MEMTGCDHPSYLCGLESSSSVFFQGVLGSARFNDHSKNASVAAVAEVSVHASNDAASLMERGARDSSSIRGPHKVSIRLFNSILNL